MDIKRRALRALNKMFNEDGSLAPEEETEEDDDDISIRYESRMDEEYCKRRFDYLVTTFSEVDPGCPSYDGFSTSNAHFKDDEYYDYEEGNEDNKYNSNNNNDNNDNNADNNNNNNNNTDNSSNSDEDSDDEESEFEVIQGGAIIGAKITDDYESSDDDGEGINIWVNDDGSNITRGELIKKVERTVTGLSELIKLTEFAIDIIEDDPYIYNKISEDNQAVEEPIEEGVTDVSDEGGSKKRKREDEEIETGPNKRVGQLRSPDQPLSRGNYHDSDDW